MNWKRIEAVIDCIDDDYICEAAEYAGLCRGESCSGRARSRRGSSQRGGLRNSRVHLRKPRGARKILRAAAACAAIFAAVSASTVVIAAAAGSIPAYDILHALYPETAERLAPVHTACEDNGIRMEVEAVSVQGDTAEIYISMQDLTEERIDETIDLFDSYSIQASGDSVGTCSLVSCDLENRAAMFLIREQRMDGKPIEGSRLVFRVSEFLSGKRETEEELQSISLDELEEETDIQTEVSVRGSSMAGGGAWAEETETGFLIKNESQAFSPVEGVSVTAWGLVDGRLHIQAHYEDIRHTDNHGYIYLKDEQGNEMIFSRSISFWDEEQTGSYEEYIFDTGAEQTGYSVWGYFCTGGELVTGDWEAAFPIQDSGETEA